MLTRFKIEYWLKKGFSESEAVEKIKLEKQKLSDQFKGRGNPFSKQYWIDRGLSSADAEAKIKARTQKSKVTNIDRGNTKGDKNPFSRAFWGEHGDAAIAARTAKSSKTVQELGLRKGDKNVLSKASYAARGLSINEKQHNKPEYWVKRGCSFDEAVIKAVWSADRASLQYYQRTYGNELGLELYTAKREKLRQNWNPACVANRQSFRGSKEANKFFSKLYKILRRRGVKRSSIQCSLSGQEYWIKTTEKIFFYDFVLHDERIIVEYNGVHVHPSPKLSFDERCAWKHAYSKKSADEIDEYTNEKIKAALDKGYRLINVWSDNADIQLTVKELYENSTAQCQAY